MEGGEGGLEGGAEGGGWRVEEKELGRGGPDPEEGGRERQGDWLVTKKY